MMRRLLAVVCLVATAASIFAQEDGKFRTAGGPDTGLGRYRVTVKVLVSTQRDQMIRELATIYRARLEPFRKEGFDGFVASMGSASARQLSRDGRVVMVEELPAWEAPTMPAPPEPPVSAPDVGTAHSSPAPGSIQRTPIANVGNDSWSTGAYAYDGSGNIKSIGTDTFAYDAYGRVTSGMAGTGKREEYTYDRFGNINTITTIVAGQSNSVTNMNVDTSTNQTGLATYDLNGRMTSYEGIDEFKYDGLGMLTESKVDGVQSLYYYTPNDERIATIRVQESNGTYTELRSQWTFRDASGRVLRRLAREGAGPNATWSWVEDYIYADGRLLAAEVPGANRRLVFHLDHLGTPRLITGDGGAEVSRHTYYPFGKEATSDTQDWEALKFTGHERDTRNLDYMHARYYNPTFGRFLSPDPGKDWDMSQPQSWNMYSYVRNNPINRTDPDGRCSSLVGGFAAPLCVMVDAIAYAEERGGQVAEAIAGMGSSVSTKENLMGAAVLGIVALDVGANIVAPGEGKLVGKGGRFAELVKLGKIGDNLTPHHMPQAAGQHTSRADGGALVMEHAEHVQTRTYGPRGAAVAKQEANLPFREKLARDIRDVRSIVGKKYNEGVQALLQYYKDSFPDLISKK